MLSDKDKEDFTEKLKKLEREQSGLRTSLKKDKPAETAEDGGRYKAINKIYEFMSMILAAAFGGYYLAKFTDTLPWTMIVVSISGFIYSFYRLYKSLS